MEILIFSDSHGSTLNMITAINRHPNIEFIIHLGDCGADVANIQERYPAHVIEAVQGNCDTRKLFPSEAVLKLVGKKIFITHGHNYGVKFGLSSIKAKGLQEKVDVVLFGHTHKQLVDYTDGILLLNPGSITKPKDNLKCTYAVLKLTESDIDAKLFEI